MTRLPIPAGVSLGDAQRRIAPGYLQGTILGDNVDTANSRRLRITCTGSGVAHTKGAWTQVIAATSAPVGMIAVCIDINTALAGVNSSALLDIGIGGAGSEVVIAANLAVGWLLSSSSVPHYAHYMLPLYIPKGSRVAVRCQGAETGKSVAVQISFFTLPNGRIPPVALATIGANTATSRGVDLAVPGATNTKGAWTEITSSTPQPLAALAVGVQGAGDTDQPTSFGLLDIGYGAAGAENVLAPDLPLTISNAEAIGWHFIPPPLIPCRLPAGTRLAARYAVGNTTAGLDVILYGIPE